MDLFHKFFVVARKNALYLPDLDQNRSLRVMDLGTGTGIWSIVVADRYVYFLRPNFLLTDGIDCMEGPAISLWSWL